ncbi:MAG: HAMP domain-containing histidine kinase [Alphaproteobacteria bacterium]|nr:HAMP domain-containing histidine kinase [Alphaproteobacteria bacterium]
MPRSLAQSSDENAQSQRQARRNVQRAVLDARQRLTSSSGTRSSYDLELLLDYAGSRISAAWALPLLMAILAVFATMWVPPLIAFAWAGSVAVTNTLLVLLCRRFRARQHESFDARRWTASFVAGEATFGLSWALLVLFLFTEARDGVEVITFALLLIGVAANTVSTRSLPSATLVSTAPATLAVSIALMMLSEPLAYAMAAIAIGAQVFFFFLARRLHASAIETLKHQSEKDALIFELEDARNMSEEARRQAERANIAKSSFLATMSHELRTPLNAIIGFSEVLKSELLGPHQVPQYKEYAGDIHASGLHLLNLINELLDLSRIEAGKYELNEEAISLGDIAEDCRRMLEIRAKTKSIEITARYGDGLSKLWADERAVRQVVLNLLSNAIKFTPQSGKVDLIVARSDDGGQYVSVRDNGPGIPESEIETVLTSFGQGSLAQKTAEQGAGLGLPIVQKIMELHQGRFDLFSKLRFGTEVIATFPRARCMDAIAAVHEKRNKLEIYNEAS